jgi:hypothetical protein
MTLLFLATADWKQPLRSPRPLALPAVALALAFLPRALLVGCEGAVDQYRLAIAEVAARSISGGPALTWTPIPPSFSPLPTWPCAPLAQLAEQLTLNQ